MNKMLDVTTRKLEKNPQIDRIKKLLFCACHGRWSKDAQGMSAKELQQCLQMFCDLHPSIVEFKHALYQVVVRLNHSNEYYGVANTLCEELVPYYTLAGSPVVAADVVPVESIESVVAHEVSPRVEHRLRSIQFKIQAPSLQQARIVCEISLEGRKQAQTIINLPLPIIQDYLRWQVAYRKLDPRLRRSPVGNGMEPSPEQINQCLTATDELMEKFQGWYQSAEWQPIQAQLQRWVPIEAPVKITINSDLLVLLKLPWHVCLQPLLAAHPQAEIVTQLAVSSRPRQVQVMAVIASGLGIDQEKSRLYLDGLLDTHSHWLVESTSRQVLAALSQPVSVLAISSYRSGYGTPEHLYINANDTINFSDLQKALRQAVERGLKLLLWNGGDGLEMAQLLAETGIPYLVVFREPLSDRVVNELLKLILKFLADGKVLPTAVRLARERLQEIERVFPAASWLPLLCQASGVEQDLVWTDLGVVPMSPSASLESVVVPAPPTGATEPLASPPPTNRDHSIPVIRPEAILVPRTTVEKPVAIAIPPVIDYDTLSLERCLTGYYSEVHSLAISADQKLIISGHGDIGQKDNNVKIWLLESGELLQDLSGHRDSVESLAALPNAQQFRSVGADGRVLDWDLATGRVTPIGPQVAGGLTAVLTLNEGAQTIGSSVQGTIYVWETSGRTLRSWAAGSAIQGLAIDAQERVLVSGGADGIVGLWEAATGRLLQQLHGHSGAVQCVAISTRGDRAVSAGVDRTIRVWDVATGEQLHILVGHDRPVNCLAITPDGGSIISGSDDKTIRIWNLAEGTLVNNLMGHGSPVLALAISKDGKMLVTGGYGEIRIWEIE